MESTCQAHAATASRALGRTLPPCLPALFPRKHVQNGQKYEPHHDYFSHPERDNNGGNRLATVLVGVVLMLTPAWGTCAAKVSSLAASVPSQRLARCILKVWLFDVLGASRRQRQQCCRGGEQDHTLWADGSTFMRVCIDRQGRVLSRQDVCVLCCCADVPDRCRGGW